MPVRLHRGGRTRQWFARRFGGEAAVGDRLWRRVLHAAAAVVLIYYLLPSGFFVVVPTSAVLLLAMAVVLALDGLRLLGWLEFPTIRPWESGRVASFSFYAVALVAVVLLFPEPIAIVAVLGTAFVDPLIGELRDSPGGRRLYPAVPLATYATIGTAVLGLIGRWGWTESILLALIAGTVALAVERPKLRWLDDDLTMTIVPAIVLLAAHSVAP